MDEVSRMKCHMKKKIDFGRDDLVQDGFGVKSPITHFIMKTATLSTVSISIKMQKC